MDLSEVSKFEAKPEMAAGIVIPPLKLSGDILMHTGNMAVEAKVAFDKLHDLLDTNEMKTYFEDMYLLQMSQVLGTGKKVTKADPTYWVNTTIQGDRYMPPLPKTPDGKRQLKELLMNLAIILETEKPEVRYIQVRGKLHQYTRRELLPQCLPMYVTEKDENLTMIPGAIFRDVHHVCAMGKIGLEMGGNAESARRFVPEEIANTIIHWNDRENLSFREIAGRLRRIATDVQ